MSQPTVVPSPPRASGRSYIASVVLIAAAGFVAVWSLSQPWVSATTNSGFGRESVSVTGAILYPLSLAAAWLGVAGVVAVVATAGTVRRAVGLLIGVSAIALTVGPVSFLFASEAEAISNTAGVAAESAYRTNMWVVTFLCGVLMFTAGLVVWSWGGQWRALSGRQAASNKSAASAWELLDRGEDPTV